MALLCKASILARSLKKYRWSVKVYQKAANIIAEITGTRMNTETLINNVV